jgi:hypothetical protein
MTGVPIHTKEIKLDKKGELLPAIYIVKIIQNLNYNEKIYYCEKTENGNNWNCAGKEINTLMTTVDYNEIIKDKLTRKENPWTIKIIDGYYTEQTIKGIDLFNCILPFLKEKTRQDGLPKNERNEAMRETCKTIMNSLSGKFLQAASDVEYFLNTSTFNIDRKNVSD